MTPTLKYPIISTPPRCPPFDKKLPDLEIPENYIGRHYDSLHLPDGLASMEVKLYHGVSRMTSDYIIFDRKMVKQ